MRPWMIAIGSAMGALAADLAWTSPEVLTAPYPWPALNSGTAPTLIVSALALYAGLAVLLVTASVALDLLRARFRIARLRPPTRSAWIEAYRGTGLSSVATRFLDLAPDDDLLLQSPFDTRAVRRELLVYYRDWLARTQAFTAFALLLLSAALSLAQRYGGIVTTGFSLSTAWTLAAVAVLLILGAFTLLFVATLAESLLAAITRLPLKRLDILLLLQIVGRDQVHSALAQPTTELDALQSLTGSLEQTSNLLRDTVNLLWTTTQIVAEIAQRTSHEADTSAIDKLSSAIQQLSATLIRDAAESFPASTPAAASQFNRARTKLRELLSDFN